MKIPRLISVLTLLVSVAVSVHAEETLRATKLPPATMRELATIELPPRLKREVRHEEKRRTFGPHTRSGRIVGTASAVLPHLTTQATIAAPPVATGFASGTSEIVGPADVSGAASKTHVVGVSNSGFIVHSRTGARLLELKLSQFWNTGNAELDFYDPRVAYDATADRWVAATIRDAEWMMIAVSSSGDPTGTWFRYQVALAGCDFTRLALTRDTILVGTTLYDQDKAKILSVTKSSIYAGPSSMSVRSVFVPTDAEPVSAPESPLEYFVYAGDSELFVAKFDQPDQPRVIDAGFSWVWAFGTAPQAGTFAQLDAGYGDVSAAVYRHGSIYAVHRIGRSARTADDNALLWWKVDPDGVKTPEIGIIDSPANETYAFPSLAVNRDGGMVITFCTLSSSIFPSASFVYRDPAGRVSKPVLFRAGTSKVVGFDRWGDYTTVVEDPHNGRDFWIGQVYATRETWETWWASVSIPAARARSVRH